MINNNKTRTIPTIRNPIAAIWKSAIHKAISQKQPGVQLYLSSTQPEMTQFTAAVHCTSGQSADTRYHRGLRQVGGGIRLGRKIRQNTQRASQTRK